MRSLREKEECQSLARTLSGWAVEKDPGGKKKKSERNVGEIRRETKRRLQFSTKNECGSVPIHVTGNLI